jgi:hypothetical protein
MARAADGSDVGADGLRDLHGERADAARGAVDQDALAGAQLPHATEALQGGEAGQREGGCLARGGDGGHGRQARRIDGDELCECPGRGLAVDTVADLMRGHRPADGDHFARETLAGNGVPRAPQAVSAAADEVGFPGKQVDVAAADCGGDDPDQHLAVPDRRHRQFGRGQAVRAAVPVGDGGTHRSRQGVRSGAGAAGGCVIIQLRHADP